jgi:hypothetical protein
VRGCCSVPIGGQAHRSDSQATPSPLLSK